MEKKSNLWRTLVLVLLAYVAFDIYYHSVDLEFYGYCKADGRTYDPHGLMDKVIANIIKKQAEGGADYVQYSSVGDFYDKNRGCCRMYAWQSADRWPLSWQKFDRFFSRWFGVAYYQLSFSYRALKEGGQPFVYASPSIDSCGEVVYPPEVKGSVYAPISKANFLFITGHP